MNTQPAREIMKHVFDERNELHKIKDLPIPESRSRIPGTLETLRLLGAGKKYGDSGNVYR